MKRLLQFILSLAVVVCARGEVSDTRQGIMVPSFRSLNVTVEANPQAPPVINLSDPSDAIVIEFDELGTDARRLRYSLTHCDARWQPEGLVDPEFLDSFNEGQVEDYDFSQATLTHYVNYRIRIPDGQIRITEPGNYLLRVYDEVDPDATLLQARFSVVDPKASVRLDATSRTDIDSNDAHQQLEIEVDTRHLDLDDPFNDLRVVITQNGRPDSERVLVTPQRLGHQSNIYAHLPALIFPAGNEYRRFETVSTTYPGIGVEHIDLDAPVVNMSLYTDTPRRGQSYLYDQTQHGRFVVRTVDADREDAPTRADYVLTLFTLAADPDRLPPGDIFIEGDLTQRRFDPMSRMQYNRATGLYEQQILLKQGAYNYQYLFVPRGSETGQTLPIEGDKYQTVNQYTVKVFHRARGSRLDRLVGVGTITTGI